MKNKSLFKKVLIGVASLLLIVVAITAFLFLYEGSTEPILSVADRFKPGESWTLAEDRVEPPRFACLDGVSCPSVHRTWDTDKVVTRDELQNQISISDLPLSVSDSCERPSNASGSVTSCRVSGSVDGYQIIVRVIVDDYTNKNSVHLYIN